MADRSSTVKVHQIYFSGDQLPELDSAFVPFDNSGSAEPDEFEFYVFRTQYDSGKISDVGFTGYVSWKFTEKSLLSGQDFITFCEKNPGYDVYFVNPFPMEICLGNVWQQGDARHPGLQKLAQHIFDHVGYKIDLNEIPRSLRLSAFCNYWVGNKKFWDEFMAFCMPIYNYIKDGLPEPYQSTLKSKADTWRHASHFAFIFERLFTTFLATRPDIRFKGYTYSDSQLRQKYTEDGAIILAELQALEAKNSDVSQPIDRSPLIKASLNLYYLASEKSFTRFGRAVLKVTRKMARMLPGKRKLLKNPFYRKIAQKILNVIRPEAAKLTLPPNSL